MAANPIPAPQVPDEQGPGPGGGFASPAPPVQDPRAANALKRSLDIVSASRLLAQDYPQVTSEVRQINDLVAKMQMKIKGGQQQPEPMAPPV